MDMLATADIPLIRRVEFVEEVQHAVARCCITRDFQDAGIRKLLDGRLVEVELCPNLTRQRQSEIRLAIVLVRALHILDDAAANMQRYGLVVCIGKLEPDHGVCVLRLDRIDPDAVTVDKFAGFGRLDLFNCRRHQPLKIVWPNGAVHYFGKFTSEQDALDWIDAHPRLQQPRLSFADHVPGATANERFPALNAMAATSTKP
jgi:hypothetical protein